MHEILMVRDVQKFGFSSRPFVLISLCFELFRPVVQKVIINSLSIMIRFFNSLNNIGKEKKKKKNEKRGKKKKKKEKKKKQQSETFLFYSQ